MKSMSYMAYELKTMCHSTQIVVGHIVLDFGTHRSDLPPEAPRFCACCGFQPVQPRLSGRFAKDSLVRLSHVCGIIAVRGRCHDRTFSFPVGNQARSF